MKTDNRVDEYIQTAPKALQEAMQYLRSTIHKAIPEVEETIKWSKPHFLYQGEIICAIMGFTKHLNFVFWRGQEMQDPQNILQETGKTNMKTIKNIKSLKDLPVADVLQQYLVHAISLV